MATLSPESSSWMSICALNSSFLQPECVPSSLNLVNYSLQNYFFTVISRYWKSLYFPAKKLKRISRITPTNGWLLIYFCPFWNSSWTRPGPSHCHLQDSPSLGNLTLLQQTHLPILSFCLCLCLTSFQLLQGPYSQDRGHFQGRREGWY